MPQSFSDVSIGAPPIRPVFPGAAIGHVPTIQIIFGDARFLLDIFGMFLPSISCPWI